MSTGGPKQVRKPRSEQVRDRTGAQSGEDRRAEGEEGQGRNTNINTGGHLSPLLGAL